MATTLVVNPSRASRAYTLYSDGQQLLAMYFDQTTAGYEMCTQTAQARQTCNAIPDASFTTTFTLMVDAVTEALQREAMGKQINTVVIRVAVPGSYFQRHAVIDVEYLKVLREQADVAPLQVPMLVQEINEFRKQFPNTRLLAASDSAFHAGLPVQAGCYSIPAEDEDTFDIRRFGYHGLSVASAVRRIHPIIGQEPERVIVCHIGSTVSVTAVKNGKSVDTSMGFSPATGLPMGSQAGDLDTAALLEIMRIKHMRPADAAVYLSTKGGLFGLSAEADLRKLFDLQAHKNEQAEQTLAVFVYHIQKAIAASTVALGGVDVIVLTATAAVRSSELRELLLGPLHYLGVQLDPEKNNQLVGKDGLISARESAVKVIVLRNDEAGEMLQVAAQFQ